MTTIALGGGPDLHQRREFAGLRDGTHVPGYDVKSVNISILSFYQKRSFIKPSKHILP